MKIGFFDSGVGGITVLHDALKILPNEDYVYYADTANVPYGSKPKTEVKKYVFDAAEFIMKQDVDAIVIACNTATSVAANDLRTKYSIPILGMEPAVKPAVEKSLNQNKNQNKRVLVTATELTLKEEKLHNLIDKLDNEHIVDLLPLQDLVRFCERFEFRDEEVIPYLKKQLSQYDINDYGTVVLGCTHFSFYKDMLRKLLPEYTDIIDGNIGTINNLKRTLEKKGPLNKGTGKIEFYNSGIQLTDPQKLQEYRKLFKRLDEIEL